MSKFYADGLRRLADALEQQPVDGELYPDQPPSFQVSVSNLSDVIAVADRFDTAVIRQFNGSYVTRVDFDGVELVIYAPEASK